LSWNQNDIFLIRFCCFPDENNIGVDINNYGV
jgi:hypothetical protein